MTANVDCCWHPFRMPLSFPIIPVVSLADSLCHRLRLLYPSGIKGSARLDVFQGSVCWRCVNA